MKVFVLLVFALLSTKAISHKNSYSANEIIIHPPVKFMPIPPIHLPPIPPIPPIPKIPSIPAISLQHLLKNTKLKVLPVMVHPVIRINLPSQQSGGIYTHPMAKPINGKQMELLRYYDDEDAR